MTSGIKRFMMYVTDENYNSLKEEAQKRSLSIQALVREAISKHLDIDSPIKIFYNDETCPNCGPDGEMVVDKNNKYFCLNCGHIVAGFDQ